MILKEQTLKSNHNKIVSNGTAYVVHSKSNVGDKTVNISTWYSIYECM